MRMRYRLLQLLSCLLVLALIGGCATTQSTSAPFAVTQVTLYDCGLAQMEREVEVKGETELSIPLPLAHLDDLLATLVVAARGDVTVTGVRYPSVFTLGQARAASSFANSAGDTETLEEKDASQLCRYVLAMVGTEVTVTRQGGGPLTGTVIDCALGAGKSGADDTSLPGAEHLLLVSAGGAMAWIPLDAIARVEPLSVREGEAIHTYARHLGRAPGLSETTVRIQTARDSDGRLAAGYIQQAPVWRMNYKLRVQEDQVYLEAWGLVHNDTDEAWQRINLSLVAGLPESYVLSVASPRYAQREGLYADGGTDMFPQLGAATPDSLLYEESVVRYAYGGAGFLGASGSVGYGYGGGAASLKESSRVSAGRMQMGSAAGASLLVKVADSAVEETAEPAVEQEISTYQALEPVTIPARASSMVPLLKRKLPGESFTLVGEGEPKTCVRLRNASGLVLQYGVASFYINGRFRGQSELIRTEPGDIRVLCFGHDADVESRQVTQASTQLKAVEFRHGVLLRHSLDTLSTAHTLANRSGQPRQMALRVTPRHNGRIVSPAASLPGEGRERFVLVTVPPRSEVVQNVVLEAGIETSVAPDVAALEGLLKEAAGLGATVDQVLQAALAKARTRDAMANESALHRQDMAKVEQALARKRTSVQSIPAAAVATRVGSRLLEEMLEAEKRLEQMVVKQAEYERLVMALDKAVTQSLAKLPEPTLK